MQNSYFYACNNRFLWYIYPVIFGGIPVPVVDDQILFYRLIVGNSIILRFPREQRENLKSHRKKNDEKKQKIVGVPLRNSGVVWFTSGS
jgi:hypothetical protein